MKKITNFFYLCLFLFLSLLAFHCKKANDNTSPKPPTPPSDTIAINKNVHVIDSAILILNSDSTLLNQGSYQYTFSGSIPEFNVNDIIVGSTNGGYIRKIFAVNKSSNKLILETTQATMEDVFANKGFNLNTGIDSLLSSPLSSGYSFNVDGQTIYNDGLTTIKINKGEITVNGDWNFGFNYKKLSLDTFEMSCKNATFNGQFDLNVTVAQSINLAEHNSTLARVAKYNIFLVGDVPVVLYTEVELRCIFSADVDASAESNYIINTTNKADVGIKYKDAQWQNFYNNVSSSSLTVSKHTGNVNAQIKLAIVPYISFRLYRVLGPYFSVGLQESVKANVTTPSLDWDFSAAAWLQTTIGVRAQILGKSLLDFNKVWNSDSLLFATPYSISKISGDNQTGSANNYLNDSLKVKVVDNNGNPQSNVTANFSVTAGSGSLEKTAIVTDNNGYAETRWKLGSEAGIQTVSASVKKANGSFIVNAPVEFGATNGQSVLTLTTVNTSSITQTTAVSGGNISNDGGATITARGVCWSTSQNPIIDNNPKITSDGIGTGSFTSNLTGLTANTAYHVRAYATNSAGTAYGNDVSFTTLATTQQPPVIKGTTYSLISWRYGATVPGLINFCAPAATPCYLYKGKDSLIFDTESTWSENIYDSLNNRIRSYDGSYSIGSYSADSVFIPSGGGPTSTYGHQYPEGWGIKLPPGFILDLNVGGYFVISSDGQYIYQIDDAVYKK